MAAKDLIPTHKHLLSPTLAVLDALGGEASIAEIDAAIVELLGLTPREKSARHSLTGELVVGKRMAWARSLLKRAEMVSNPKRGYWSLTQEGRAALALSVEQLRVAVDAALD